MSKQATPTTVPATQKAAAQKRVVRRSWLSEVKSLMKGHLANA